MLGLRLASPTIMCCVMFVCACVCICGQHAHPMKSRLDRITGYMLQETNQEWGGEGCRRPSLATARPKPSASASGARCIRPMDPARFPPRVLP
ncbi:hypothetical protein LY76DRAFT_248757 [Colletotrichum caudatum]|nr:hypothetical protein LY76DRAFT_248757 [Colletotrichum caudatum]